MQSTSKVKTGIEMLTSGVYPVNTRVYIGLRSGVLFQGIFCSPLLGRLRFAVKKNGGENYFVHYHVSIYNCCFILIFNTFTHMNKLLYIG